MAEYDIALEKQIEWSSFWTSDYGMSLYNSIGESIAKMRSDKGELGSDDLVKYRNDEAVLELAPLINGECFFWSRDMVNLITTAADSLPESWSLMKQAIPAPVGFFFLDKPIKEICAFGWNILLVDGDMAAINMNTEDGKMPDFNELAIISFLENEGFPAPIPTINHISVGQSIKDWRLRLSDLFVSQNVDGSELSIEYETVSIFATMLSFIQQKILVASRQFASRPTRRRAEPSNREAELNINVIKLCKLLHRTHKGYGEQIDWQCRWLVRGHWRDQWFPSIRRNQPIWIAPYVKGPEDKPLREPGRLFAVIR